MKRFRRTAAVIAGGAAALTISVALAPAASANSPRPPGLEGCEWSSAPKSGVEGLLWGAAYGPSGSQNNYTYCNPASGAAGARSLLGSVSGALPL